MATVKKTLVSWKGGPTSGIELGKTYKVNESKQTFKDSNGLERDSRWGKWFEHSALAHVGQPIELKEAPLYVTGESIKANTISLPESGKKYRKKITDAEGNTANVDVYDVLKAFNVTDPALQHLIKKGLNAGNRGHKDLTVDLQDITDSAIRAQQLNK